MNAYVIYLPKIVHSVYLAQRAIQTGAKFGVHVIPFEGVDQIQAPILFKEHGFKISKRFDSQEILHRKANFRDGMTGPECGAFMSHYKLWERCLATKEPIIILEHDAIFINSLLPNFKFKDICVLTHRTASWMTQIAPLWDGTPGIKPFHSTRFISAVGYAIQPHAAKKLIEAAHTHAVSEVDNFITTAPGENDCAAIDITMERHDPCVVIHPPVNEFSTINHEILKTRDPWY